MDLTPYIEGLQRDLTATAEPGGAEVRRAAELLTGSMEASARLCLLEALSDAAAEITVKLGTATVDVRLRGRDADLTVTHLAPEPDQQPVAPQPVATDGGELTRITLRLPEALKEQVERAAAVEGISVNGWLVRAVAAGLSGRPWPPTPPMPPMPPGPPASSNRSSRRLTGFAQA